MREPSPFLRGGHAGWVGKVDIENEVQPDQGVCQDFRAQDDVELFSGGTRPLSLYQILS
ncbi:hypothetical protein [Rhodococcus koreensis]